MPAESVYLEGSATTATALGGAGARRPARASAGTIACIGAIRALVSACCYNSVCCLVAGQRIAEVFDGLFIDVHDVISFMLFFFPLSEVREGRGAAFSESSVIVEMVWKYQYVKDIHTRGEHL